jgi:hypothetical protein
MDGDDTIREQIAKLPSFKTLDELLYWMVDKEKEFNAYK